MAHIGVLDCEPVLAQLEAFQASRPHLKIVNVKTPSDAQGLHVLYMSKAATDEYRQFLKPLVGKSTLIVCEDRKDMLWGVDIAFYETKTKMGYKVDQQSLERRNLVASSKLLGLSDSD